MQFELISFTFSTFQFIQFSHCRMTELVYIYVCIQSSKLKCTIHFNFHLKKTRNYWCQDFNLFVQMRHMINFTGAHTL